MIWGAAELVFESMARPIDGEQTCSMNYYLLSTMPVLWMRLGRHDIEAEAAATAHAQDLVPVAARPLENRPGRLSFLRTHAFDGDHPLVNRCTTS